ncbi:pentapeptide repeat-containing protein [Roseivirga sp. E12]|uniref:pentapeptide repeat-containing protein n=1 Tax=Roseivirga sp. E12 TaxID=2819237 RepID=UPI001ABCEB36|nr:pentapeptide repeat-containing protein [Roseivirga sp. E12]MBO3697920.1 pentapeptide repeat-containing protein [Roseivirga sp. E12]
MLKELPKGFSFDQKLVFTPVTFQGGKAVPTAFVKVDDMNACVVSSSPLNGTLISYFNYDTQLYIICDTQGVPLTIKSPVYVSGLMDKVNKYALCVGDNEDYCFIEWISVNPMQMVISLGWRSSANGKTKYLHKTQIKDQVGGTANILESKSDKDSALQMTITRTTYYNNYDKELIGVPDFSYTVLPDDLDFSDQNFEGANFHKAIFAKASFKNAILRNADFKGAKFNTCDFRNCDMTNVQINSNYLGDSKFNKNTVLKGVGLTNLGFEDQDLSELNFSECDLTEVFFTGCSLVRINMSGAEINDSSPISCDLSYCNFQGSTLNNVLFMDRNILKGMSCKNASLLNCDFSKTSLVGSDFRNCTIKNCDFSQSDLSEVDFKEAILKNCNFSEAFFKGADFTGAELINCNFSNCNEPKKVEGQSYLPFEKADFTKAYSNKCNFGHSDLRKLIPGKGEEKIKFYNVDLNDLNSNTPKTLLVNTQFDYELIAGDWTLLDMSGAKIQGDPPQDLTGLKAAYSIFPVNFDLGGRKLDQSDFRHSELVGANFKNTKSTGQVGPNFFSTNLSQSNFHQCKIERAICDSAIFEIAILSYSNFSYTSFIGAILGGEGGQRAANFANSNLQGVCFDDANLVGVDFSTCYLPESTFERSAIYLANFSGSYLVDVNFSNIQDQLCEGVDFSNSCLLNTDFRGTKLLIYQGKPTDLSKACLQGANFNDADLSGANLADAGVAFEAGVFPIIMKSSDQNGPPDQTIEISYDVQTPMSAFETDGQTICPNNSFGACKTPDQYESENAPTSFTWYRD